MARDAEAVRRRRATCPEMIFKEVTELVAAWKAVTSAYFRCNSSQVMSFKDLIYEALHCDRHPDTKHYVTIISQAPIHFKPKQQCEHYIV